MDFYKPFHDLFNEVAITNRRLLELLKDHENEEITELLLRQDKAISKAMLDYRSAMEQNKD